MARCEARKPSGGGSRCMVRNATIQWLANMRVLYMIFSVALHKPLYNVHHPYTRPTSDIFES